MAASLIMEVYNPKWLANPVLVLKKKNRKWKMCTNYTSMKQGLPEKILVPFRALTR